MTALTMERQSTTERWTYHKFLLAAGSKAWRHGLAAIDLATGKVVPAAASGDLLVIGKFDQSLDLSAPGAADAPINVNLGTEIEVEWWAQDGTILAADIGQLAYVIDDQTVGGAGTVLAGRVWAVDPLFGAAIQKLWPAEAAPVGP